MEEWRARLQEMVNADERSMRSLSAETGFGSNYVQQLLKDEKDPSFPRLAKLLSILGQEATLYVILGIRSDAATLSLRSALLAYGVDKDDLVAVMKSINGFVNDVDGDELPQSDQPHGQSEPASPRHGSEPSSKRPQRSTS